VLASVTSIFCAKNSCVGHHRCPQLEHLIDKGLVVLLAADELAPVTVYNEGGSSPLLIVADHAGNSIPRRLGRLGVSESEIGRHIGWDITLNSGHWQRTSPCPLCAKFDGPSVGADCRSRTMHGSSHRSGRIGFGRRNRLVERTKRRRINRTNARIAGVCRMTHEAKQNLVRGELLCGRLIIQR
jgi:hypothetical protein